MKNAVLASDVERSTVGSPPETSASRFVRAIASVNPWKFLISKARGDVLFYVFATERTDILVAKQGQLKGLCATEDSGLLIAADSEGSVLRLSWV